MSIISRLANMIGAMSITQGKVVDLMVYLQNKVKHLEKSNKEIIDFFTLTAPLNEVPKFIKFKDISKWNPTTRENDFMLAKIVCRYKDGTVYIKWINGMTVIIPETEIEIL